MSAPTAIASNKKHELADLLDKMEKLYCVQRNLLNFREQPGGDRRNPNGAKVIIAKELEGMGPTAVEPAYQADFDLIHMLIRGVKPLDLSDAIKAADAFKKLWPEYGPVEPEYLVELSASLQAGALGDLIVPASFYPEFILYFNHYSGRCNDGPEQTLDQLVRAHSHTHAMSEHFPGGNRPSLPYFPPAGGVVVEYITKPADRIPMSLVIPRMDQWIAEQGPVVKEIANDYEELDRKSLLKNIGSHPDLEEAHSRAKRCFRRVLLERVDFFKLIHEHIVYQRHLLKIMESRENRGKE